jgi:mono/diheme cytochrome c family protein
MVMRIHRFSALAAVAVLAALLATPLVGQEYDPIFNFIPSGGRTLLAKVLDSRPPAAEVRVLLTTRHTREEWVAELKARTGTVPALKSFSEHEFLTLADYLAVNMPMPAAQVPADPAKADFKRTLPRDGRDLALNYCQSCHIITVTVTQDRTREHWLGTMNKPSHVLVKLSPQERDALARYLVINAGIPIDQVPEDLRAGGATY